MSQSPTEQRPKRQGDVLPNRTIRHVGLSLEPKGSVLCTDR